jgi:fructan beta-fructosidase
VFWHEDGAGGGHWAMALAVGQSVWFYSSPDLRAWTKGGEFGAGRGAHGGVWETPELLRLPVEGGRERRWALVVAVQGGAPAGGSGTQYFLGEFDGATFRGDDAPGRVRWLDYGADFYAPQLWNDAPDGRALGLAWMSNWDYARQTPATAWRGAMTAPRELRLVQDGDDLTLAQRPVAELEGLRRGGRVEQDVRVAPGGRPLAGAGGACEIVATLRADGATSAARAGVRLLAGDEPVATIGYDLAGATLRFERSGAGELPPGFAAPQSAPLAPRDGLVRLRLLVDRQSVELFADDGRVTLTNQIFPGPGPLGAELFAEEGAASFAEVAVHGLGR